MEREYYKDKTVKEYRRVKQRPKKGIEERENENQIRKENEEEAVGGGGLYY